MALPKSVSLTQLPASNDLKHFEALNINHAPRPTVPRNAPMSSSAVVEFNNTALFAIHAESD